MTTTDPVIATDHEQLIKLENERLKLVREIKLILIFGPIATLASMILFVVFGKYAAMFFFLLIIGCGLGSFALLLNAVFTKRRKFRDNFRRSIMASMIKMYKPEMEYNPTGRISQEVMESSLMFPVNANQYFGNNYMRLQTEDYWVECAEMKTFYDNGMSGDHHRRSMIFGGTFFAFTINKPFAGYTVIMSERNDWLTQTVQNLNYRKYEKHEVNAPGFEEKFNVYTNNPMETAKILSSDFKKALNYLHSLTGAPILVSFSENRLCFGFKHMFDYFSPNLNKSILDPNELKVHSGRLKGFLDIIETFDFFIKRIDNIH